LESHLSGDQRVGHFANEIGGVRIVLLAVRPLKRKRVGCLSNGAPKSLRRFSPIFGAWSCLELLSSHGNHGYVAV